MKLFLDTAKCIVQIPKKDTNTNIDWPLNGNLSICASKSRIAEHDCSNLFLVLTYHLRLYWRNSFHGKSFFFRCGQNKTAEIKELTAISLQRSTVSSLTEKPSDPVGKTPWGPTWQVSYGQTMIV